MNMDSQLFIDQVRQSLTITQLNPQSVLVNIQMAPDDLLTALLTGISRVLKESFNTPQSRRLMDVVIGFDSLYVQAARGEVFYQADIELLHKVIQQFLNTPDLHNTTENQAAVFTVKACYHPDIASDLISVAREKNLAVDEVISLHTSAIYTVYAIGFMPGFAYMGHLPKALHIDRKATPRMQVPAGSVGLAHNQTGIYPRTSPGGWQIIARTTLDCFNANLPVKDACPFDVGQKVKFEAITLDEYQGMKSGD